MKVLIGQSYLRILDPKELERQMPYPPLGTLYAASELKKEGHEIIFYDGMLSDGTSDFINTIRNENFDVLVIYDDEFNYLTKMCLSNMRDAALSFISVAKQKNKPVIVYSSDATDFYNYYLDAGCDAIIYGEGENTLKEVITSIKNGSFLNVRENISGLKFMKNGKMVITSPRKMIENLDEIPDPDYSLINIEKYREIWIKLHGYFSMNLSTTRGCPYKCNWCAKPLYGKIYHSRSAKKTAENFKQLKDKYSVDHIWITDDIFGLKSGWIEDFDQELKNLKIKIPYKCLSRPDILLRGNTLPALKNSGCDEIWIGAESGSQKILDSMDKGTTVEQIYESAYKTRELGMRISFFIQFGYTGENKSDIRLTRKMINDCLPDDIGISVSYPLPGTKFYDKVKGLMKSKTNWEDSDDLDLMFPGSFDRSFYKILHRLVHNEYRLHKIIRNKQWSKLHRLIIYFLRYLYYSVISKRFKERKNPQPKLEEQGAVHSI